MRSVSDSRRSVGLTQFNRCSQALNCILIKTLTILENSLHGEGRLKAANFKNKLMSYELILTAYIYLRIFDTCVVSQYSQTSGLDLQKAHKMVMQSIEQLQCISRDFADIVAVATERKDK